MRAPVSASKRWSLSGGTASRISLPVAGAGDGSRAAAMAVHCDGSRSSPQRATGWVGPQLASPALFVDLVDADTNVARLAAVCRAENTGLLQLIHDAGRASVPDAELALQE